MLTNLEGFLRDVRTYSAIYEKLERLEDLQLVRRLLTIGRDASRDTRSWTKPDLEDILRSKRLHRLLPRIERTPDVDERLEHAFKIQDEEARIQALCKIPGVGPVLASVMLALTWPEAYGVLDYHAWNALSSLGFDLPKKENDGSTFKVPELLGYLRIVRRLAKDSSTIPRELGEALHALDKVNTKREWRQQFVFVNSSIDLSHFGQSVTKPVWGPNLATSSRVTSNIPVGVDPSEA